MINEFLKGKNGLFYQAKEDSKYGNLRSLSHQINPLLGLPEAFAFDSYESAINALLEKSKGQRFVFAIDEYSYTVKQDPNFPSKLKREYYLFFKSGFTADLIESKPNNVHTSALESLFRI